MMVYRHGRLKTLDLSDNGLLHAPRELWDDDCNPRVANLTLSPGNPDLPACGELPDTVRLVRLPSHDFNTLVGVGSPFPSGIWSDDTTMWVADFIDQKLYAYALSTKARDSGKDIDLSADFGTFNGPNGIWSDGTTMWAVDSLSLTLLAYKLTPGADFGAHDSSKDIALASDNGDPWGLWSDGETMWVTDKPDLNLYAYNLSTKARDSGKDVALTSKNGHSRGIWSDGTTMWVADNIDAKLYAYNLSTEAHDSAKDAALASNNDNARGIWSDGETMWVTDVDDDKIYAYSIPARFFQEGKRAWSATMTVGSSTVAPTLFGWDGPGIFLGNDDLTGADFVYENETYEFTDFFFDIDTGRLSVNFDATNNGSISDAAVRHMMTLYVDGKAFSLGDATYSLEGSGAHALTWQNAGLTWAAGDNVQLDLTVTPPVWSATMTVGSSTFSSSLFGWDGDDTFFGGDALTDADFVYDHETYEIDEINFNTNTVQLTIILDATNSGSISDAAVRNVMTLYADGAAFALEDATYSPQASGASYLTWSNTGLTWAAGDTVELEMRVTR